MDESLVERIESRKEIAIIISDSIYHNNGLPVNGRPTLEEVAAYIENKGLSEYFEGVCLIHRDGSASFYGLENERYIPPRDDLKTIKDIPNEEDLDETLRAIEEIRIDNDYLEDQVLDYAKSEKGYYPQTLFIVHSRAKSWTEKTFEKSAVDCFFLEI